MYELHILFEHLWGEQIRSGTFAKGRFISWEERGKQVARS
jgi:hypothetical protein